MDNLSKRIKELRLLAGMSQADLAFDMDCGTSTISSYENGKREPSQTDLMRLHDALADVIGDNRYYLVTGEQPTPANLSKQLESQYIKRTELIPAMIDFLSDLSYVKEIRFKKGLNPKRIALLFAKHHLGIENNGLSVIEAERKNGS